MARLTQKILVVGMAALVCLPLSSCTTNPLTNKKFSNFSECMTANIEMAAGGGVLIDLVLRANDAKPKTANTVAVVGALIYTYAAWQTCAQTFQEVSFRDVVLRDTMPATGANAPGAAPSLRIDELSIVATKWGEPLVTTARYTLIASDKAKVDIPLIETRTFIDLSKPDVAPKVFAKPVVVQQSQRTSDGKIPTPVIDASKGPHTFTFEVEADGMKSSATVEYFFDGKKHSAVIATPANGRRSNSDAKGDKQSPAATSQHHKTKPLTPAVKKSPSAPGI